MKAIKNYKIFYKEEENYNNNRDLKSLKFITSRKINNSRKKKGREFFLHVVLDSHIYVLN